MKSIFKKVMNTLKEGWVEYGRLYYEAHKNGATWC